MKQFTMREGLGDDHVYAVACDRQGRIWAGHLNRGVSVFDGERWRNYPVGQGPVGERVFDIAVCPTDGDVWLATNCGLTRYSVAQDTWSAVAAKEGLPLGAVQSIAFTAKGDLVAGMQDGSVAIGTAVGGYRQWKLTAGPQQLPSDLITAVLVTREGLITLLRRLDWRAAAMVDEIGRLCEDGMLRSKPAHGIRFVSRVKWSWLRIALWRLKTRRRLRHRHGRQKWCNHCWGHKPCLRKRRQQNHPFPNRLSRNS